MKKKYPCSHPASKFKGHNFEYFSAIGNKNVFLRRCVNCGQVEKVQIINQPEDYFKEESK